MNRKAVAHYLAVVGNKLTMKAFSLILEINRRKKELARLKKEVKKIETALDDKKKS